MVKDEKVSEHFKTITGQTMEQARVDTAFGFAQKLIQAKNLQDLARIQTEFLKAQMKSLTEQAKDLSETATKAAAGALKNSSS